MSSLHLIVIVAGVLGAFILACMVGIIGVRMGAAHASGTAQSAAAEWDAEVTAALAGNGWASIAVARGVRKRRPRDRLIAVLTERAEHATSSDLFGLRRLARLSGLTTSLVMRLRSERDPWRRVKAARLLGLLRETEARDQLLLLLDDSDPAVVFAGGYACALLGDHSLFLPVLRRVYEKSPVTLHGMADLLTCFGEGICPHVQSRLEGVAVVSRVEGSPLGIAPCSEDIGPDDVSALVLMVDVLSHFGYRPAAGTLEALLDTTVHEEVAIHVIKALGKIGSVSTGVKLKAFLQHQNWIIRSQAAKAVGSLCGTEARTQLELLLGDPNWWVRYHAEHALAVLQSAHPEVVVC